MTGIRVALDLRALEHGLGRRGIGRYIRGLATALFRQADEQYTFVCLTESAPLPLDVPPTRSRIESLPLARPHRRRWLWEQALTPLDLLRARVALFHQPAALTPDLDLGVPVLQPVPVVATVYDLMPMGDASDPWLRYVGSSRAYRVQTRALRRCAAVTTISDHVGRALVSSGLVESTHVRVIYPGLDAAFSAKAPGLSDPCADGKYLLTVGGGPNKNVAATVEAFLRLRRDWPDLRLLVVDDPAALGAYHAAEGVVATGRVSDLRLTDLYRNAAALVYPSLDEGFGLPVLEALGCGCPVVTSNVSSLPEVAGDAAILCPPRSVSAIVDAVASLLTDQGRRAALTTAGLQRSQEFDWNTSARQLLQIYAEVAGNRNSAARRSPLR
ncbi:MAG: glycosyltransferase family 4 protein [Chloroflexi bacterium]|nr:glycosyltransferase family 4 protein [Chloroflexota bacterium]